MANFYDRFSTAATRFPSQTAIELQSADQLLATTYGQLEQQGAGVAGWLHAQGVVPDDRVAILADNDARWIAAYMGALRLGATAVPLDTAYKAGQVRTVIDNSGARLIFTTARYLDRVREAVSEWPGFVVCLLHGNADGLADFDEMQGSAAPPSVAARNPDDAAVILYTSGTTADPKGVVLTHANLDAERLAAFSVVNVNE